MKRSLILISIALILATLTACNDIQNDITKSYENVSKKSSELKAQIIDTVNKIEETKKDVEEAKEAVNKVFE